MAKIVLSRDLIVDQAFRLIDEKGIDDFSLRKLAGVLGVQVSSLYNHISNENDLLMEVAKRAGDFYTELIAQAVKDLPLEESTIKACDTFWDFLKQHRHLYNLLIDERWVCTPEFEDANESFIQPIYFILQQYGITDKASMDHLYVVMRTITHGFSTLETIGVFDELSVDPKESYHLLAQGVIDYMKKLNKKD